jgi:hypothetical protein
MRQHTVRCELVGWRRAFQAHAACRARARVQGLKQPARSLGVEPSASKASRDLLR